MLSVICRVSLEGQALWYEHHKVPTSHEPSGKEIKNDTQLLSSCLLDGTVAPSSWIKDALRNESCVTTQLLRRFESILHDNLIISKDDLARVPEQDFKTHLLEKHESMLMPIGVKIKFQALYTNVRADYVNNAFSNTAVLDKVNELYQMVIEIQSQVGNHKNINPNDFAPATKLRQLQNKLMDTTRKFDAFFESNIVDHGNQIQEVVRMKDGVKINVQNPRVEQGVNELGEIIMKLQDDLEVLQTTVENKVEKQKISLSKFKGFRRPHFRF